MSGYPKLKIQPGALSALGVNPEDPADDKLSAAYYFLIRELIKEKNSKAQGAQRLAAASAQAVAVSDTYKKWFETVAGYTLEESFPYLSSIVLSKLVELDESNYQITFKVVSYPEETDQQEVPIKLTIPKNTFESHTGLVPVSERSSGDQFLITIAPKLPNNLLGAPISMHFVAPVTILPGHFNNMANQGGFFSRSSKLTKDLITLVGTNARPSSTAPLLKEQKTSETVQQVTQTLDTLRALNKQIQKAEGQWIFRADAFLERASAYKAKLIADFGNSDLLRFYEALETYKSSMGIFTRKKYRELVEKLLEDVKATLAGGKTRAELMSILKTQIGELKEVTTFANPPHPGMVIRICQEQLSAMQKKNRNTIDQAFSVSAAAPVPSVVQASKLLSLDLAAGQSVSPETLFGKDSPTTLQSILSSLEALPIEISEDHLAIYDATFKMFDGTAISSQVAFLGQYQQLSQALLIANYAQADGDLKTMITWVGVSNFAHPVFRVTEWLITNLKEENIVSLFNSSLLSTILKHLRKTGIPDQAIKIKAHELGGHLIKQLKLALEQHLHAMTYEAVIVLTSKQGFKEAGFQAEEIKAKWFIAKLQDTGAGDGVFAFINEPNLEAVFEGAKPPEVKEALRQAILRAAKKYLDLSDSANFIARFKEISDTKAFDFVGANGRIKLATAAIDSIIKRIGEANSLAWFDLFDKLCDEAQQAAGGDFELTQPAYLVAQLEGADSELKKTAIKARFTWVANHGTRDEASKILETFAPVLRGGEPRFKGMEHIEVSIDRAADEIDLLYSSAIVRFCTKVNEEEWKGTLKLDAIRAMVAQPGAKEVAAILTPVQKRTIVAILRTALEADIDALLRNGAADRITKLAENYVTNGGALKEIVDALSGVNEIKLPELFKEKLIAHFAYRGVREEIAGVAREGVGAFREEVYDAVCLNAAFSDITHDEEVRKAYANANPRYFESLNQPAADDFFKLINGNAPRKMIGRLPRGQLDKLTERVRINRAFVGREAARKFLKEHGAAYQDTRYNYDSRNDASFSGSGRVPASASPVRDRVLDGLTAHEIDGGFPETQSFTIDIRYTIQAREVAAALLDRTLTPLESILMEQLNKALDQLQKREETDIDGLNALAKVYQSTIDLIPLVTEEQLLPEHGSISQHLAVIKARYLATQNRGEKVALKQSIDAYWKIIRKKLWDVVRKAELTPGERKQQVLSIVNIMENLPDDCVGVTVDRALFNKENLSVEGYLDIVRKMHGDLTKFLGVIGGDDFTHYLVVSSKSVFSPKSVTLLRSLRSVNPEILEPLRSKGTAPEHLFNIMCRKLYELSDPSSRAVIDLDDLMSTYLSRYSLRDLPPEDLRTLLVFGNTEYQKKAITEWVTRVVDRSIDDSLQKVVQDLELSGYLEGQSVIRDQGNQLRKKVDQLINDEKYEVALFIVKIFNLPTQDKRSYVQIITAQKAENDAANALNKYLRETFATVAGRRGDVDQYLRAFEAGEEYRAPPTSASGSDDGSHTPPRTSPSRRTPPPPSTPRPGESLPGDLVVESSPRRRLRRIQQSVAISPPPGTSALQAIVKEKIQQYSKQLSAGHVTPELLPTPDQFKATIDLYRGYFPGVKLPFADLVNDALNRIQDRLSVASNWVYGPGAHEKEQEVPGEANLLYLSILVVSNFGTQLQQDSLLKRLKALKYLCFERATTSPWRERGEALHTNYTLLEKTVLKFLEPAALEIPFQDRQGANGHQRLATYYANISAREEMDARVYLLLDQLMRGAFNRLTSQRRHPALLLFITEAQKDFFGVERFSQKVEEKASASAYPKEIQGELTLLSNIYRSYRCLVDGNYDFSQLIQVLPTTMMLTEERAEFIARLQHLTMIGAVFSAKGRPAAEVELTPAQVLEDRVQFVIARMAKMAESPRVADIEDLTLWLYSLSVIELSEESKEALDQATRQLIGHLIDPLKITTEEHYRVVEALGKFLPKILSFISDSAKISVANHSADQMRKINLNRKFSQGFNKFVEAVFDPSELTPLEYLAEFGVLRELTQLMVSEEALRDITEKIPKITVDSSLFHSVLAIYLNDVCRSIKEKKLEVLRDKITQISSWVALKEAFDSLDRFHEGVEVNYQLIATVTGGLKARNSRTQTRGWYTDVLEGIRQAFSSQLVKIIKTIPPFPQDYISQLNFIEKYPARKLDDLASFARSIGLAETPQYQQLRALRFQSSAINLTLFAWQFSYQVDDFVGSLDKMIDKLEQVTPKIKEKEDLSPKSMAETLVHLMAWAGQAGLEPALIDKTFEGVFAAFAKAHEGLTDSLRVLDSEESDLKSLKKMVSQLEEYYQFSELFVMLFTQKLQEPASIGLRQKLLVKAEEKNVRQWRFRSDSSLGDVVSQSLQSRASLTEQVNKSITTVKTKLLSQGIGEKGFLGIGGKANEQRQGGRALLLIDALGSPIERLNAWRDVFLFLKEHVTGNLELDADACAVLLYLKEHEIGRYFDSTTKEDSSFNEKNRITYVNLYARAVACYLHELIHGAVRVSDLKGFEAQYTEKLEDLIKTLLGETTLLALNLNIKSALFNKIFTSAFDAENKRRLGALVKAKLLEISAHDIKLQRLIEEAGSVASVRSTGGMTSQLGGAGAYPPPLARPGSVSVLPRVQERGQEADVAKQTAIKAVQEIVLELFPSSGKGASILFPRGESFLAHADTVWGYQVADVLRPSEGDEQYRLKDPIDLYRAYVEVVFQMLEGGKLSDILKTPTQQEYFLFAFMRLTQRSQTSEGRGEVSFYNRILNLPNKEASKLRHCMESEYVLGNVFSNNPLSAAAIVMVRGQVGETGFIDRLKLFSREERNFIKHAETFYGKPIDFSIIGVLSLKLSVLSMLFSSSGTSLAKMDDASMQERVAAAPLKHLEETVKILNQSVGGQKWLKEVYSEFAKEKVGEYGARISKLFDSAAPALLAGAAGEAPPVAQPRHPVLASGHGGRDES